MCKIPKDLVSVFSQSQFSISLQSNSYKHCKLISYNLYKTMQCIFDEVREGFMMDITIDDVKIIESRPFSKMKRWKVVEN